MEAIAKAKFLRGSPQKTRLVIDLIRGKNVADALAVLQFTNKRATENIEKCLRSAIANATHKAEQQNVAIDPDDLWVKTYFVDMGPHKHRRRVRPAPQGRAYREQRYYCHITIELSSDKPEGAKDGRKAKKAVTGTPKPRRAESKHNDTIPAATTNDAPMSVEELQVEPSTAPAASSVEEIAGATTPIETTQTAAEQEAASDTTTTATSAPVTEEATATDGETTATAETDVAEGTEK